MPFDDVNWVSWFNAPINVGKPHWGGGGGVFGQRVGIRLKSKNFGQFPEGGKG